MCGPSMRVLVAYVSGAEVAEVELVPGLASLSWLFWFLLNGQKEFDRERGDVEGRPRTSLTSTQEICSNVP